MAKKKEESAVFEIVIVMAIVAIVAVTGQVLLNFEKTGNSISLGGSGATGYVVAGEGTGAAGKGELLDIGVSSIEVNPPSPLMGEPFEIRITVVNEGSTDITTPFYVAAELRPNDETVKPTILNNAVTQKLAPGGKAEAVMSIAFVTKEGPLKIIATADSTFKLDDDNLANNQRSKTVIISSQ